MDNFLNFFGAKNNTENCKHGHCVFTMSDKVCWLDDNLCKSYGKMKRFEACMMRFGIFTAFWK